MIPANELRIGNWIGSHADTTSRFQVKQITADGVDIGYRKMLDYSEFIPIPLTDEVLEQFGFVEKGFVNEDYDNIEWYAAPGLPDLTSRYDVVSFEGTKLPHIKYLHQLQNLYHALTGKELEIKSLTNETSPT